LEQYTRERLSTAAVDRLSETQLSHPQARDLASMLLIRHFERRLLELFAAGMLNGTTHTCLGQEYVPVALEELLREDDHVFGNHRSHGHYLARFDDPVGLLAEIMGRHGAICAGVGGSQHLMRDTFLSTGVQGQAVPVAVGVALHLRNAGLGQVAVAYIGDGTWGEGAVYEALNIAVLWRLPFVLVVENNAIAMSTATLEHLAGSVAGRAAAFGADYARVDSIDVGAIRRQLAPMLSRVRHGSAPLVVEFMTVRIGPHSKGDDTRTAAELDRARERDWYTLYSHIIPERFAFEDARQRDRVESVVHEVTHRPPTAWEPTCNAPSV
jgi:acetoin:2,6-dichlorophenolindophenol oxidoreductase subunit alpha